jgi:hypothetical protein
MPLVKAISSATLGFLLCVSILGCHPAGPAVITKAKYDQLQSGMSYQDAVKLIGSPGVHGPDTSMGDKYMWRNPDGSLAVAVFKNGVLDNKTQTDLE